MKKQIKTLVILLAVAAVLVGGIFIAKHFAEKQTNEPIREERTVVFKTDVNKITRVEWTFSDRETLVMEKQPDSSWRYADEPETELNGPKVMTILNSIAEIPVYTEIEDTDMEAFGFADPTNLVKITAEGKEYTFTFGKKNALQDRYYLLYDGHNYLVELYENAVFDKKRDQLKEGYVEDEIDLKGTSSEETDGESETDEEPCETCETYIPDEENTSEEGSSGTN